MKPYRVTVGLVVVRALVVLLLVSSYPLLGAARDVPQRPPVARTVPAIEREPLVRQGFDHFYSLEYDRAIRSFEAATKKYPDDPFAVNYLLSAVIFKELYRIGALDSEMYAGNNFADKPAAKMIDPAVKARIYELIDQATKLAEARLKVNPVDVDALYARGATRSMRSTWMGPFWAAVMQSAPCEQMVRGRLSTFPHAQGLSEFQWQRPTPHPRPPSATTPRAWPYIAPVRA